MFLPATAPQLPALPPPIVPRIPFADTPSWWQPSASAESDYATVQDWHAFQEELEPAFDGDNENDNIVDEDSFASLYEADENEQELFPEIYPSARSRTGAYRRLMQQQASAAREPTGPGGPCAAGYTATNVAIDSNTVGIICATSQRSPEGFCTKECCRVPKYPCMIYYGQKSRYYECVGPEDVSECNYSSPHNLPAKTASQEAQQVDEENCPIPRTHRACPPGYLESQAPGNRRYCKWAFFPGEKRCTHDKNCCNPCSKFKHQHPRTDVDMPEDQEFFCSAREVPHSPRVPVSPKIVPSPIVCKKWTADACPKGYASMRFTTGTKCIYDSESGEPRCTQGLSCCEPCSKHPLQLPDGDENDDAFVCVSHEKQE